MKHTLTTGAEAYCEVPGLGLVPCVVTSITAHCIRAKVTQAAGPYKAGHPFTCLNTGTHSAIVPASAVRQYTTCTAVLKFTVEIDK